MKGDFTRDTFSPAKHFSRVLMQQGRVTLDADHNEQIAIDLYNLRRLARDVIGPSAAPAGPDGGFALALDPNGDGIFTISQGRYYVDGILVENDTENCTYRTQPDFPVPSKDPLLVVNADTNQVFWVYLDVWERHITSLEDDSIRETALGGPNTCTRAKISWQVRALPVTPQIIKILAAAQKKSSAQIDALLNTKAELLKKFQSATDTATEVSLLRQLQPVDDELTRLTRLPLLPVHETFLSQLVRVSNASLAARVKPGIKIEDACVTPPDSKYRGAENQLYRVEIHRSGTAGQATFKWSRDNGSVATAWIGGEASDLQVASTRGFAAGSWVELCDDNCDLLGLPGALVQLAKVEGDTLSVDPATTLPSIDDYPVNPKVRLWNQTANDLISLADDHAITIQESPAGATADKMLWFDLEDGVQIQFSAGGNYRTGDYWLIPARVATGNVEWPQADELNPQPLPPHGIEHHYALLGAATRSQGKWNIQSLRCEFWPIFFCAIQTKIPEPTDAGPRPVVDPGPVIGPRPVVDPGVVIGPRPVVDPGLVIGPRPVISADPVFVPPRPITEVRPEVVRPEVVEPTRPITEAVSPEVVRPTRTRKKKKKSD